MRKAWRSKMLETPAPKQGCFHLTYPNTEWQEVPCRTAPDIPYPMRTGPARDVGGAGGDFAAQVAGSISTATGFWAGVSTNIGENGPGGANDFALQLNTNQFNTPVCAPPLTTPVTPQSPSCIGWQQFIFSNFSNGGFIQYWLLRYFDNRPACSKDVDVEHGGCCPSGWNTFKSTPEIQGVPGCFRNGPMTSPATPLITLTAESLFELQLTGRATANTDTVIVFTDPVTSDTANGPDSVLDLAGNWKAVEFNIVGDGNSHQARFNDGSTIDVMIDVGTEATCATPGTGLTGESNNLTIVQGDEGPCCATGSGIRFTQSNAAGAKSICDAGPHCLPPGAACSVTGGLGCCAIGGLHDCKGGFCVPHIPPPTCDGTPRPVTQCGHVGGWHCCDPDGWVCGNCQ